MSDNTERKIEDGPGSTAAPIGPLPGGPEPRPGAPTAGLSQSPGLRTLPSQVPSGAGGAMVNHVMGPGQSPVDPIAAGLDTGYDPMTRAENRLITLTGTIGSGNPPSTHLGHDLPGPISDMSHVPAVPDAEAQVSPGPNSAGGDAPSVMEKKAEPVVKKEPDPPIAA